MHTSPIIFFAYNRPEETRNSLNSLKKCALASQSILYIFCDGPKQDADENEVKRIEQVVKIVQEEKWCGEVVIKTRIKNAGLAPSIIEGVSQIISIHGKCIVLEDDLVLSPHFLTYMNEALEKYKDDDRVISIHGYTYPIDNILPETFFIRGADCWGWATWRRGWELFEPDGVKLLKQIENNKLEKIFNYNNSYDFVRMLKKQVNRKNSSWAILWYATAFLNNKLTLYPGKSLVNNIGADGRGTHVKKTDLFKVAIWNKPLAVGDIEVIHNEYCWQLFSKYFRRLNKLPLRRMLMNIKYR